MTFMSKCYQLRFSMKKSSALITNFFRESTLKFVKTDGVLSKFDFWLLQLLNHESKINICLIQHLNGI